MRKLESTNTFKHNDSFNVYPGQQTYNNDFFFLSRNNSNNLLIDEEDYKNNLKKNPSLRYSK